MKQNSILTFCEALCVALLFAGMLISAILSMSINTVKDSKKELEIENQKIAEDSLYKPSIYGPSIEKIKSGESLNSNLTIAVIVLFSLFTLFLILYIIIYYNSKKPIIYKRVNYILIGSSIISFVIAFILTIYIPDAKLENIKNNDNEKYKPWNIEAMDIFSYIFYIISGLIILSEFISYFEKK
jgi:hypothetical protein